MMMDIKRVVELLRSPDDGTSLQVVGDEVLVSAGGRRYSSVKGKPLLINFARSRFEPSQYAAAGIGIKNIVRHYLGAGR